ncbi:Acyl-CoA synthetase [Phaffia rhodozyma]|uniref:Acyl-CoA synthetase n=1 Tax=Phaffia rhodozyma TaxID=264483 RepID=A0A0F7SVA4_PHARH|nr:Acyl-CoA synthetase [Phaffia rhodozyma]
MAPSTLSHIFPTSGTLKPRRAITIPQHDVHISHSRLQILVEEFGSQLGSLGIKKGDVVSLCLTNGLGFVLAFLATGGIRAVSAPLNPHYTQAEVEFYLQDTQTSILILPVLESLNETDRKGAEQALSAAKKLHVKVAVLKLAEKTCSPKLKIIFESYKAQKESAGQAKLFAQVDGNSKEAQEDDVALVLHTSGTTGKPKAVPLTHLNLLTTVRNIIRTYKLSPSDTGYLVMPLFHVHGLMCGLLSALYSGGGVVIPARFSPTTFWPDFTKEKCSWYTAVPTIHSILLSAPLPSPIPNIRFIRSCSSSLSPTVFHNLEKTFKAPVLEAYAMTEAAHQMTSNPLPEDGQRRPGCVGRGQGVEVTIRLDDGKEVKTGEVGEVCIRGKNVTNGYVNNPKANRENFFADGWFRTGDQGKLDKDGYLSLTGRLKELINRGGEKISPLEIDSAILSLEGVGEAVCFGVPNEKYGEIVWAAVVPKSGAKLSVPQIQKDLGPKIAKYKIPERVFIVKSIPKTATGKIQRRHVSTAFVEKAKKEDSEKGTRESKL